MLSILGYTNLIWIQSNGSRSSNHAKADIEKRNDVFFCFYVHNFVVHMIFQDLFHCIRIRSTTINTVSCQFKIHRNNTYKNIQILRCNDDCARRARTGSLRTKVRCQNVFNRPLNKWSHQTLPRKEKWKWVKLILPENRSLSSKLTRSVDWNGRFVWFQLFHRALCGWNSLFSKWNWEIIKILGQRKAKLIFVEFTIGWRASGLDSTTMASCSSGAIVYKVGLRCNWVVPVIGFKKYVSRCCNGFTTIRGWLGPIGVLVKSGRDDGGVILSPFGVSRFVPIWLCK